MNAWGFGCPNTPTIPGEGFASTPSTIMPRVLGPKHLHLSVEPRERMTSQGSLRDLRVCGNAAGFRV